MGATSAQPQVGASAHGYHCVGCGCRMHHPGAATADAGQAYEALRPMYVYSCLVRLFKAAGYHPDRANSDSTVSIWNTARFFARAGGRASAQFSDRRVYWLGKIFMATVFLTMMRIYKLGAYFLAQIYGIPIGGPISGAILDIVMAVLQADFDTDMWPRIAGKSRITLHGPRSKYIYAWGATQMM